MVIERVELSITPGREEEFESAMTKGRVMLEGAAGCRAVTFGRGIEAPSKFLLLLQWDSVDDHTAFTRTPDFRQFGELAGPFFSAPPSMEHFAPLPVS